MIAWGHTATGAVTGAITYSFISDKPIEGLIIAGAAGVVSHYLIDLIPHGHFVPDKILKQNLWKIILFDFLLSVFLFLFVVFQTSGLGLKLLFVLFGIGGAVFPDAFNGVHLFGVVKSSKLFKAERRFHEGTHWYGVGESLPMLSKTDTWQVLTILFCLYLVTKI